MKLSEVVSAINAYDRAVAACSYGASSHNIGRVYELLPIERKLQLSNMAADMSKSFLDESEAALTRLNILPGEKERDPSEYRLTERKYDLT